MTSVPESAMIWTVGQSIGSATDFLSSNRAILAGCIAVVCGCVLGAMTLQLGRRTRNWLYYVETVGAALVVAGIAGQRAFPSDDAVRRIGADAANQARPGVWESGTTLPGFGFWVNSITVLGFIVIAAGVALLLFFESEPRPDSEAAGGQLTLDMADAE